MTRLKNPPPSPTPANEPNLLDFSVPFLVKHGLVSPDPAIDCCKIAAFGCLHPINVPATFTRTTTSGATPPSTSLTPLRVGLPGPCKKPAFAGQRFPRTPSKDILFVVILVSFSWMNENVRRWWMTNERRFRMISAIIGFGFGLFIGLISARWLAKMDEEEKWLRRD